MVGMYHHDPSWTSFFPLGPQGQALAGALVVLPPWQNDPHRTNWKGRLCTGGHEKDVVQFKDPHCPSIVLIALNIYIIT